MRTRRRRLFARTLRPIGRPMRTLHRFLLGPRTWLRLCLPLHICVAFSQSVGSMRDPAQRSGWYCALRELCLQGYALSWSVAGVGRL